MRSSARIWQQLGAILVLLFLLSVGVGYFQIGHDSNEQFQQQLLATYRKLELEGSEEDVMRIVDTAMDASLRRFRGVDASGEAFEELRLSTPTSFGAKNWVLIIILQNGHTAAYGIRTEDFDRERPPDAPMDYYCESFKEYWRAEFCAN